MTKSILSFLFIFLFVSLIYSQTGVSPDAISGIKGYWKFDDTTNVSHASFGTDLGAVGYIQSVKGVSPADHAVRLGVGAYFNCIHNIPANGSGSPVQVNKYTLLYDFKINQFGMWRCFYQTDPANTSGNDGEVFISPSGNIGVSATGYSSYALKAGEWYRLVISVSLGNHFDYYLDGQLLFSGTSQTADGRFALYPSTGQNNFLLFADDNGEDHVMDISQVAVYGTDLSAVQVDSLGGFGHALNTTHKSINAYLQSPTSTSIYISWHSAQTSSTLVQYGTTQALGFSGIGAYETIDVKNWHTVKLSGLIPDTRYYYRCISGSDTSQIYEFRTPFEQNTPGKHLRFAMIGDSQSDINMPAVVSNAMEDKFRELYGPCWVDSVSFVLRSGDMVGDGSVADSYEKEYFNPFGNLSHAIPFMISIGNHEGSSNFYYQYMKYEDFSDYAYPNTLCERFYSFKVANCKFVAINTNTTYQISTQTDWLHNKLEQSNADPSTDFVFTYNHHPGHSEMWPDGNNTFTENTVYAELANYPKVALNFYGHSHNYESGVFKSTHSQPQDFRIMCLGGAGAYLDRWGMYPNQTDYPEIQSMYDYYSYVIVDVDVDNKSYTAITYSLGNPDLRMNNIPIETCHYYTNRPEPLKPLTLSPINVSSATPILVASAFNGQDSMMTSQFQITIAPGNWATPLLDSIRDYTDIFGNSGAPDYTPVDMNAGIDLRRLQVPVGKLSAGSTYAWRVRYRDRNIKWSEWSEQAVFTVSSSISDSAAFVADTTSGNVPLTVHFTDLSTGNPTAWTWDFDNDGNDESSLQDPVYTYTAPGLYSVKLTTSYGVPYQTVIKNDYINITVTALNENENSASVIYPNPFNENAALALSTPFCGKKVLIEIYNSKGMKVKTLYDDFYNDGQIIRWDGSGAANGVYYCHIKSDNMLETVKIVKIH